MSQKVIKRSRRHTEEEDVETVLKAKEENGKNETNGLKDENGLNRKTPEVDANKRIIQTRSRSNTPMKKNLETVKTNDQNSDIDDSGSISLNIDDSITDKSIEGLNGSHDKEETQSGDIQDEKLSVITENEKVQLPEKEIENIVAEPEDDENIPELQYDENDVDVESEGSPSRCKTRRSQTRQISTPKTPKVAEGDTKVLYIPVECLPEDGGSERSTPKKGLASSVESNVDSDSQPDEMVDLDNSDSFSSTSIDNISTKALAGGDATRNTDLTYQDSALLDDTISSSPALNPNRSLTDTLRGLSSRRTIRPLSNDYRKRAIRNNLEAKGDLFANYESVEKITPGTKRKNRSITPEEDIKRMRREGAGLFSYISSPIFSHFRNKSSSPKLLSYEKKHSGYDEPPSKAELEIASMDEHHKKWCSIM